MEGLHDRGQQHTQPTFSHADRNKGIKRKDKT
jgi:hypothetical protein